MTAEPTRAIRERIDGWLPSMSDDSSQDSAERRLATGILAREQARGSEVTPTGQDPSEVDEGSDGEERSVDRGTSHAMMESVENGAQDY
eukprot:7503183-Alexandrium_andersonii.AAC.1